MSRSKRNFQIPLPAVDLRQMVEAALLNVDYHLSTVVSLLKESGLSTLWDDDPSIDESTKHNLQGRSIGSMRIYEGSYGRR